MGLKGLLDRNEDPSDAESEREALRRQRIEGAAELDALKRTLAERVAFVQQRERELAEAQARVEKHEQRLVSGDGRVSRLDSVRLRLAEAKATRAALDARANELARREAAVAAKEQGHSLQAPEKAAAPRRETSSTSANASSRPARTSSHAARGRSPRLKREAALEAGNDKVQLPVAAHPKRANATDTSWNGSTRSSPSCAMRSRRSRARMRSSRSAATRLAEQEEALAKARASACGEGGTPGPVSTCSRLGSAASSRGRPAAGAGAADVQCRASHSPGARPAQRPDAGRASTLNSCVGR